MAASRLRPIFLIPLFIAAACASAEDRFKEGIRLQSQGRYIEAVYRYAEAVEKDRELVAAQERLLAAGDTAVMVAMDDADELERRGDPVQAAGRYRQIDQMLARIREVGLRPILPGDYAAIRRAIFDNAIYWQMTQGDDAAADGRWEDAVRYYQGARGDYLPSRDQVEASYDAETALLLRWAEIELGDAHPRSAYDLAQRALEVRSSPARETVLAVRDIQDRALADGTIVVAVVPVTAEPGVREWLGGEFEIQLDNDLSLDHWTQPPLFVQMADPLVLRRELRGLLRGQATQSPMVVGRALDLIGADLGVMVRLTGIEVSEEDVDRDRHEAVVRRNARRGYVMADDPAQAGGPGRPGQPGQSGVGDDPPGGNAGNAGNSGRGPVDQPPGRDGDPGGGRGPGDRPNQPDSTGNPGNGRGPVDQPPGRDGDPGGGRGPGDRPNQPGGQGQPGGNNQPGGDNQPGGQGQPGGDPRNPGVRPVPYEPVMDTVVYETVRGTMSYFVEAEIILVDPDGREVNRFMASSRQSGPFERGEFAGDPRILPLEGNRARFFDPAVLSNQMAQIEGAVMQELAAAIAVGTYDQILAAIR